MYIILRFVFYLIVVYLLQENKNINSQWIILLQSRRNLINKFIILILLQSDHCLWSALYSSKVDVKIDIEKYLKVLCIK